MASRINRRNKKSPAVRGLAEAREEGYMKERQKLIKHIDKLLEEAEERELRLLLIAAHGILRK